MIGDILKEEGVYSALSEAQSEYLLAQITNSQTQVETAESFELRPLATTLESIAINQVEDSERSVLFEQAFILRRRQSAGGSHQRLAYLAHLAADGIMAKRSAEVLMLLRNQDIPELNPQGEVGDFADHLIQRVLRAFVLLVRRAAGWSDVRAASDELALLRKEHSKAETLTADETKRNPVGTAIRLLYGFNLAKIVDVAATYTATGQPANALLQVDRHRLNMQELERLGSSSLLGTLGDSIALACSQLIQTSIWNGTALLGKDLRNFIQALTSEDRSDPVLELWPSQRKALETHLLDPARRAVVVEMPTSAGKTLLAEFSIVQAKALNPDSTVAYVVPTRALVNQITKRLRHDLGPLGLSVEAAVPVFDLDPTEDRLLQSHVNVLVCTPEKLDLLIKSGHSSVEHLSLAVMDEAHNLAEGSRGVRMELLLGAIKRERPETRFLLLTPFVPNADQLSQWLGDSRDSVIHVDWRPSERIAATAHFVKRYRGPYDLTLTTRDSVGNVDVPSGLTSVIGETTDNTSIGAKKRLTRDLCQILSSRGSVLVLARGRKTAETRAEEIAHFRQTVSHTSPYFDAVVNYARAELGSDHLLPSLMKKGVVYHHAGLSHDLRYLLESLIEAGEIDIAVGTTTLAQGLNFPISTVIVETLTKPLGRGQGTAELSYSEFWNIAGRAGRALLDPLGLVVFPAPDAAQREEVVNFLRREAAHVASALIGETGALGQATLSFDLKFSRENPALSIFLQYLAHVTRLAGAEQTAGEIEDVLRSSLVYHQAFESDRKLAEALVSLSRQYVREIGKVDRGFLALADGTGFSLASARFVYASSSDKHPEFLSPDFWQPSNLFSGDPEGLANVIEVLADVPEMSLGISNDPGGLNATLVAGVVQDWVSGKSVQDIGERWFSRRGESREDATREAGEYIYRTLVGQIPWGMGALQRLLLGKTLSEDVGDAEAHYTPSMVFYGVPTPAASLMRMGGVPRFAAESLGRTWLEQNGLDTTFGDLRDWLKGLSETQWGTHVPADTPLSGADLKILWESLTGT